jgi:hypothetical protein
MIDQHHSSGVKRGIPGNFLSETDKKMASRCKEGWKFFQQEIAAKLDGK